MPKDSYLDQRNQQYALKLLIELQWWLACFETPALIGPQPELIHEKRITNIIAKCQMGMRNFT